MTPGDASGRHWGTATYGQPCAGCGFWWHRSLDDAVRVVAAVPDSYARILAGATGDECHPNLAWSVSAYVCHVGDNLRIWAERLAGLARGAPATVSGYDEGALGRARGYGTIPLPSALWSLGRSVADWLEVVGGPAGPRRSSSIPNGARSRLTTWPVPTPTMPSITGGTFAGRSTPWPVRRQPATIHNHE